MFNTQMGYMKHPQKRKFILAKKTKYGTPVSVPLVPNHPCLYYIPFSSLLFKTSFLHLYKRHFWNYKMLCAAQTFLLQQFLNALQVKLHPLLLIYTNVLVCDFDCRLRTGYKFRNQYLTLSIFILLFQYKIQRWKSSK